MLWFYAPLFDHKISITAEAASGWLAFLGFLQRNLFLAFSTPMAALCQSKNLLTMLAQRDTYPQLLTRARTYPQSCKQKKPANPHLLQPKKWLILLAIWQLSTDFPAFIYYH